MMFSNRRELMQNLLRKRVKKTKEMTNIASGSSELYHMNNEVRCCLKRRCRTGVILFYKFKYLTGVSGTAWLNVR